MKHKLCAVCFATGKVTRAATYAECLRQQLLKMNKLENIHTANVVKALLCTAIMRSNYLVGYLQ